MVIAPFEADAQIAFISRSLGIPVVLSSDSDMVVYQDDGIEQPPLRYS